MTDARQRPDLAVALGLEPHPEGGWFRETYRSSVVFDTPRGVRAAATAIFYLLTPGEGSRWHVVASDELWLWHHGGPLELLLGGDAAAPIDSAQRMLLGPHIDRGEMPQVIVPPGVWQSARPASDEEVLVSCVVAPGFDFADFKLAD